jgi:phytoene dehydrogenase-like protein
MADDWDAEADVIVIGSGIGGLTCAAMAAYYGHDVRVYESHSIPGGCAHGFERNGFNFDSGPSLWNGMSTPPYNPLRQVLNVLGEGDSVAYAKYDGWGMHVPVSESASMCVCVCVSCVCTARVV